MAEPKLLATIREALYGQIDRNRRLSNEFYGEMSRHYVERGERCRAALDHLAPLPDDAVLVGLDETGWYVVRQALEHYAAWQFEERGNVDRCEEIGAIAATIRRQTGEG